MSCPENVVLTKDIGVRYLGRGKPLCSHRMGTKYGPLDYRGTMLARSMLSVWLKRNNLLLLPSDAQMYGDAARPPFSCRPKDRPKP